MVKLFSDTLDPFFHREKLIFVEPVSFHNVTLVCMYLGIHLCVCVPICLFKPECLYLWMDLRMIWHKSSP